MLTKTIRPYSEQEKQQLLARLPSRWAQTESFLLKLIFLVPLFLAPLLLSEKYFPAFSNTYFPAFSVSQAIATIAAVLLAVGSAYWIARKYEGDFQRPTHQAAIVAGRAEILHVITSRAVERADPEDFGTAYYLEVQVAGEPRLLYLQGQYFDELEEGLFPNTEFNLVRTLATKEVLDLELLGQPFLPERVLPAFAMADWQRGLTPEDGAILTTKLDELT
jgi:hypothetical protein